RRRLGAALEALSKERFAASFAAPVDLAAVYGYGATVALPMDLALILRRLEGNYYRGARALAHDCHLIIVNCLKFNLEDSGIARQSQRLASALAEV
ncbi:Bromodomain-containing protein, partial [Tribonema minus]